MSVSALLPCLWLRHSPLSLSFSLYLLCLCNLSSCLFDSSSPNQTSAVDQFHRLFQRDVVHEEKPELWTDNNSATDLLLTQFTKNRKKIHGYNQDTSLVRLQLSWFYDKSSHRCSCKIFAPLVFAASVAPNSILKTGDLSFKRPHARWGICINHIVHPAFTCNHEICVVTKPMTLWMR